MKRKNKDIKLIKKKKNEFKTEKREAKTHKQKQVNNTNTCEIVLKLVNGK